MKATIEVHQNYLLLLTGEQLWLNWLTH